MSIPRTILSLLVCGLAMAGTEAFSDPVLLTTRTLMQSQLSTSKHRNRVAYTSGRRRNERFYKEHTALSIPFSGPRAESGHQSWEDIIAPPSLTDNGHTEITVVDKVVLAGTLSAAILSISTLLMVTASGSWRYFVAGGICAATSHSIPTPIDVVKTRKQVDPSLANKPFITAARDIAKEEGMGALWAGLGPTAWGYLIEGSVKFGTYEILKPIVKKFLNWMSAYTSVGLFNSQVLTFMLCGVASGFAASLLLCPMEAIRIRMVAEPSFATGGWVQAGYKMLKQEGVVGLCKGMVPMISKQVPYTVTKNVSFDVITSSFYAVLKAQGTALTAASMFIIPLISALIASVLSTISSQPGDMILSLVNAHQGDRKPSEFFNSIMKSDKGIRGFFVGFKTRLLHVGVTVTIQLLVYDYVKRMCGIAATGTC